MATIKTAEIAEIFHRTGGFLEGHFLLSSGLHSPNYMQCARVLQHPQHAARFGEGLAAQLAHLQASVVAAPAMGGIIVGWELARSLGVRSIFAERIEGLLSVRRGQEILRGERVLLVEDVVTTGKSIREIEVLVEEMGAVPVGMGCIVDRTGGRWEHRLPLVHLVRMELITYPPAQCPLCEQGLHLDKPGSRPSP